MLLVYSGLLATHRTSLRILILSAGGLTVLPAGQQNTSKKAMVILGGTVKQQATTEGIPLVWDGFNLRAYNTNTDSLVT